MGAMWVNGRFSGVRGTFYWDLEDPLSGSCVGEIDVANLQAGEPHLNTELRAADFLDPGHHRTIGFSARVSKRMDDNHFQADTLLTLRGATRHVVMDLCYLGEWHAPKSPGGEEERAVTRLGLIARGFIRRQDFEGADGVIPRAHGARLAGGRIEIALDLEAVLDEDLGHLTVVAADGDARV
jgi:polyisoprenoid-binding protein YceI